jgi:hypothetical protein
MFAAEHAVLEESLRPWLITLVEHIGYVHTEHRPCALYFYKAAPADPEIHTLNR